MNLKTFICFLFGLILISPTAFSQDIKLNDLVKIDLFSSGPWWAEPGMRWVEVIPEGKEWASYHLRSQQRPKLLRDSTRRLIKTIPISDLKHLLDYVNKPDTMLNFEQFNVPIEQLKQFVDSLQNNAKNGLYTHDKLDSLLINLTASQKAYFYKIIESKQAVKDAGLKAFHPFMDDDRSYYGMTFTYKDKHRDSVYAYVNSSHLYHLPWQIKNKQSYNPHLTNLFESIMGNEGFEKKEQGRLSHLVDRELFNRWVLTKILWDNYKANHLASYKQLSKTVTPVNHLIQFKSSRLPFNIQFKLKYPGDDTLDTYGYNKSEKEMVDLYKRGGFFFDYLKAHPATIAVIQDVISKTIEQVAVTYPDIRKFDIHQIKSIYTSANFYQGLDIYRISRWLMLPNGNMILLYGSDELIHDGDKIFSDLTPVGKEKGSYYCIVYDKQRHKIAGGKSKVKIELK
jgi:hypothetical protein